MKDYPELTIGSTLIVKHKNDSRIYELTDIAVWEKSKTIKTIKVEQIKLPYFPSDKEKKELDEIRKSCKIMLRNEDKVIVKTGGDSKVYQIIVRARWKKEDEIGGVNFNKKML